MPTFDTPDSDSTYTVPSGVEVIELVADGAGGGDGADGVNDGGGTSEDGHVGSNGGSASGTLSGLSGGETFSVHVASAGENGSNPGGGAAGLSPLADGGAGGDGGNPSTSNAIGGGGGGAGGTTAVVRDSDSAVIIVAEGGGGGGGGDGYDAANDDYGGGGGGGGGARGGAGGAGGDGSDSGLNDAVPGTDGSNGAGTGNGGDGGDGQWRGTQAATDGSPGGTVVHADLSATSETNGGGNAGDGQVVINEAPPAPSVSIDSHTDTSISFSWADVSGEDSYDVDYREQGAGSWTDFSTLAAGSTSDTITGLTQGTTYEIRVGATNTVGTSYSSIVSQTTDAPAPTLDSVTVNTSDGDKLDVAWTRNGSDETAYRVLISFDGGAFTQDGGDLAGTATSYTTTELLDGEQYTVKVRAVYNDTTADSGTQSATTELPDAQQPTLDNSTEDELGVSWTDVIDNGEYELQYRETGASTWTNDPNDPYSESTTSATLTGLEDGEAYEVRMRTTTEHSTGAWTTPVSATTVLPAPTGFSVDARDDTVDTSWTDNADNEDEYRLEYSTDGGSTWSTATTVSANSTSASHSSPPLYQQVDYRVVAVTEHSTATSSSVTTVPVNAGHFYSEIDRGGTTDIIPPEHVSGGSLSREHTTVSGMRIELVPADTDYEALVQGDVTLFYGADQYFLGSLIEATQSEGVQTLRCDGHLVDLEEDAPSAAVTYQNMRLGDAIDDYWSNQQSTASATTHVAFANAVRTDELWYDVPDVDAFPDITSIPSTEPFIVNAGSVKGAQTLWFLEGENGQIAGGTTVSSSDTSIDYSNDGAAALSGNGDQVEVTFTPQYDIPKEDFDFRVRNHFDNLEGDIVVDLDNQELFRISFGSPTDDTTIGWGHSATTEPSSDLQAGTQHTVTVKLDDYQSGTYYADAIAPHDTGDRFSSNARFSYNYTFDNSVTTPGFTLSGPELHPEYAAFDIVANENWFIPELDLTTTFDQTDNSQQLAASTDGSTFLTADNTETATFDFDANDIIGDNATMRVRLGRTDSGTAPSPTNGDTEQEITTFEARIDTSDLPIIGDTAVTLDGDSHLANVQKLHNQGPFRFVVDHTQSTLTVDSFRKGDSSLVKSAPWTAVDGTVERTRSTEDYFNRIRAYGDGVDVDIVHSAEESSFGVTVIESRRYDETDVDALAAAARDDLIKAVSNDEFRGGFEIAPKIIAPGWPYTVPEFGSSQANLERVTFELANGTGRLDFGRRAGLVAEIQQRTR